MTMYDMERTARHHARKESDCLSFHTLCCNQELNLATCLSIYFQRK